MTIYVLDTSSLLVLHIPENSFTCNHVLMEVRNVKIRNIILGLTEGGVLRVVEPSEKYVDIVHNLCLELGEVSKLSIADIHVVSLALEFRDSGGDVVVLTDDFSIQNILKHIGVNYNIIRRGIRRRIKWVIKCSRCGAHFSEMPSDGLCPRCGDSVSRFALSVD